MPVLEDQNERGITFDKRPVTNRNYYMKYEASYIRTPVVVGFMAEAYFCCNKRSI